MSEQDNEARQEQQDQVKEQPGGQLKGFVAPKSQEELDQIITNRLARERSKFADYDSLKAQADEFQNYKDSQLSAQEKAVKEAKEEGAREVLESFQKDLVNSEIKTAAVAAGFQDPEDAVSQFGSDLPLTDEGKPDVTAIAAKVKDIGEKKPYLLKEEPKPALKGRPKPPAGQKSFSSDDGKETGKAAAALRQYAQTRKLR